MLDEPKTQYWGASSVFSLAVQIMQHVSFKRFLSLPMETSARSSCRPDPPDIDILERHMAPAPKTDVLGLVRFYMRTLNTIYILIDESTIGEDLHTYLTVRNQADFSSQSLKGDTAHQFFRISLMCAAACATEARHPPSRVAESLAYYQEALGCVEEVTSEASPASLQALLLLIILCLFYPRKGEIWRLLDYACRLAIELGYHKEDPVDAQTMMADAESSSTMIPPAHRTATRRQQLQQSTFWALYTLERIMGQMFGRASDLPESIITASYPSPAMHELSPAMPFETSSLGLFNVTDTSGPRTSAGGHNQDRVNLEEELGRDNLGTEQTHEQTAAFAHHYRLVYLRSKIYRAMYIPPTTPAYAMEVPWLCEQYAAIQAWRGELPVSDDFASFSTITCLQGYNQTICFLFQPLLLQALRSTQLGVSVRQPGSAASPQEQTSRRDYVALEECAIVADSYWAACELLHAYERLVRAPQGSLLGSYPLTFLSAQYIWLASSTIVGHILIALDGRVRKVWCFRRWHEDGTRVEGLDPQQTLDYGSFIDVSPVCLMLLRWCADRWPGMSGLLEVYESLIKRLNRELISRGMVV